MSKYTYLKIHKGKKITFCSQKKLTDIMVKNNVLPCTDLQQKTICSSVNQNRSKPTTAATQQLSLCNHYKTGPPGKTN